MVTETKDNGKKILKLGNWQVFLLGKLHDLYLKNEQCNITLKFDGGESIQAHRLVLASCTTFFDHLPQVHQPVVLQMPHTMVLQHVKSIIGFMYTGRLEYEAEEQMAVFSTAKNLGMSFITEMMQAQIQPTAKKRPPDPKMYKKLIHKHTPPPPPPEAPSSELECPPLPPSAPQGTPLSALPGKKLPFWKKRSPITLPDEFYQRAAVIKKPLLPLVVAEEPKPTRFEWPENHSLSEANLHHNLTGDSFEHLSYNSKVDLKHFTDAKPVISEGSISKMPETSLSGTKRSRSSEVLKGSSCDDEDYDDGHFEDIHDIGDDAEEVTPPQPVVTPPRPILKTVSTPTPSKKVRFSFSSNDNVSVVSEVESCTVSSSSNTCQSTSVITSTQAATLQSTSTTNSSNATPVVSASVNPKIISEILRKFPELAKSNKNIKLKIQSGPLPSGTGSSQSVFVDKDKGQKTVQYVVVKPDSDFIKKAAKTEVVMGAENRTGPWFCVTCASEAEPLNFDTYYNYRRHLQDVHNERIDARICEHCGYKASKRNLHLYHLYTRHNVPPPRNINFPKCDQCSYIALSESLLIKHRINHTGMATSEYVCRLCNAAFKSNGALMGHMQTNLHQVDHAAKKDYKCNYCDKVFHRNINLKAHVRTSHQLDSIRRMYDDEDRVDEPSAAEEVQLSPVIRESKEPSVKNPLVRKVEVGNTNAPKVQRTLREQSNENVMEVIGMPVFNSVAGGNKTLFIHHPGMTILAESPSVPMLPSSESEAMSNVATGIATSINITERNIPSEVIVIDAPEAGLILQSTPQAYVLNQDGSYSVQEYIVPEIINDSGRVYTTALVSSAPTTGITYVNSDNIAIISSSDHTYADGMKINGAQVSLVASSAPTQASHQPIIVHSGPMVMSAEWVQSQPVGVIATSVSNGQQQTCPPPPTAQTLVNDWGDLEEDEEEEEASQEGGEDDEVKPSRLSVNVVCPMDENTIE